MSKNEMKKTGLHKEISSIFKGVVIPQEDDGKESSGASILQHTNRAIPKQLDMESQKDEVTKSCQAVQTLSEAEPVQEPKAEPIEESGAELVEGPKVESVKEPNEQVEESKAESIEEAKAESVQEPKVEPVAESRPEPIQESKVEPAHSPKFLTAQESKVIPIEESEVELARKAKDKSVSSPKFVTAQESEAKPNKMSENEPTQETKDKLASPPKFLTAQESKVIPIEESDVEPTQEAKDKSVSSPKFLTAQESEVKPAKEPENEPVNKSKLEKPEKPKVIPVQKSKKTGIGKISKKVSEKRSVVKVGNESSWKQITGKLFAAKPGASTTKQKAMVVMVPLLFIVLLVFVLRGGVFGTSVPNVEAGQQNNVSDAVNTGTSAEIDWEIPEPYPTTLRDPVKLGPVVKSDDQTGSVSLAGLKVRSILCSEDKSSAIVGSSIVHEGDDIGGGVKIIKITKDGVEFEMDGKKWIQGIER